MALVVDSVRQNKGYCWTATVDEYNAILPVLMPATDLTGYNNSAHYCIGRRGPEIVTVW